MNHVSARRMWMPFDFLMAGLLLFSGGELVIGKSAIFPLEHRRALAHL